MKVKHHLVTLGAIAALAGVVQGRPAAAASSCGGLNQRACKVWERLRSCDKGLVEIFGKGVCVRPSTPKTITPPKKAPGPLSRGAERPCRGSDRVPSCTAGSAENVLSDR